VKIEDVIILGAGASASEGAPLQKDLFKEYFRNSLGSPVPSQRKLADRLARFFSAFFGVELSAHSPESIGFPTVEEVLGILELALTREESFRELGQTPMDPQVQRTRQDLVFSIALAVAKGIEAGRGHHKILVERLKREQRLRRTAFVSLNYDICMDNALVEIYPDYDLDYGVDFTNFRRGGDWTKPRISRAVNLCKLHGSLNWLYCPACVNLTLTIKKKSAATLAFEPIDCKRCDTAMVPIVVPPSYFKAISNYYLQAIWRRTESILQQAKRIFICGYSFPDADIHVKYLLKRAQIARGHPFEVLIVNSFTNKDGRQSYEENLRISRFFGTGAVIRDTGKSFEEFAASGLEIPGIR
jgi:hypothetical protein